MEEQINVVTANASASESDADLSDESQGSPSKKRKRNLKISYVSSFTFRHSGPSRSEGARTCLLTSSTGANCARLERCAGCGVLERLSL